MIMNYELGKDMMSRDLVYCTSMRLDSRRKYMKNLS
jgi:hypothetical protein